MSRLRYASFALVAAALLLATGSGAFSSADASRASSVGVASDQRAYLGVTVVETEGTVGGGSFSLLELTDNFPEEVDVDSVSLPNDAPISYDSDEVDGDVEVVCEEATGDEGESVTLEIAASGETIEVTKNEEVTVTCIDPEETPTFRGCGRVDTDKTIEQTVLYSQGNGQGGGPLVGVRVDGRAYKNPNFDFENTNCGNSGGKRPGIEVTDPPWTGNGDYIVNSP
jgi:hypothetical protein